MMTFAWTGRDAGGKPAQGEVSAANRNDALRVLRGEGKIVVSIGPKGRATVAASSGGTAAAGAGRIIPREPVWPTTPKPLPMPAPSGAAAWMAPAPRLNRDDVRAFSQQMAVMLETGVSLSDALDACVDPKLSPGFAKALRETIDGVRAGMSFSVALSRNPRVFSPLFVNMVRASEASGQLGSMLRRLADFLAGQHALARRIRGAVAYPMVMLTLAVGVVIFLMVYVLPKFTTIYAGRENLLPAVTRAMMALSSHMQELAPYLIGGTIATAVGGFFFLRSPTGRSVTDRFKLALPLFGPLLHKTYLARSLRTFGALIQAGVSVLESVELTSAAAGSATYERLWLGVREKLQHGLQISDALRDHKLVPRSICKMLEAGERGGKLADATERVALHTEEEVAADIKTVTGLVEPAIVIFLGLVVGTVVMAMLLPIFTLSKAMSGGH